MTIIYLYFFYFLICQNPTFKINRLPTKALLITLFKKINKLNTQTRNMHNLVKLSKVNRLKLFSHPLKNRLYKHINHNLTFTINQRSIWKIFMHFMNFINSKLFIIPKIIQIKSKLICYKRRRFSNKTMNSHKKNSFCKVSTLTEIIIKPS